LKAGNAGQYWEKWSATLNKRIFAQVFQRRRNNIWQSAMELVVEKENIFEVWEA
jgi:hypothetical protein